MLLTYSRCSSPGIVASSKAPRAPPRDDGLGNAQAHDQRLGSVRGGREEDRKQTKHGDEGRTWGSDLLARLDGYDGVVSPAASGRRRRAPAAGVREFVRGRARGRREEQQVGDERERERERRCCVACGGLEEENALCFFFSSGSFGSFRVCFWDSTRSGLELGPGGVSREERGNVCLRGFMVWVFVLFLYY